ncbi:MAG: hypothetical protein LVQ96_04265 [Thermoplasmatales archaeon]|nr:hypothetical protein [Thermoplasmatales archaeon]MCW6170369.1 hypothetical protein [Thermoplasmatales archaeon]
MEQPESISQLINLRLKISKSDKVLTYNTVTFRDRVDILDGLELEWIRKMLESGLCLNEVEQKIVEKYIDPHVVWKDCDGSEESILLEKGTISEWKENEAKRWVRHYIKNAEEEDVDIMKDVIKVSLYNSLYRSNDLGEVIEKVLGKIREDREGNVLLEKLLNDNISYDETMKLRLIRDICGYPHIFDVDFPSLMEVRRIWDILTMREKIAFTHLNSAYTDTFLKRIRRKKHWNYEDELLDQYYDAEWERNPDKLRRRP